MPISGWRLPRWKGSAAVELKPSRVGLALTLKEGLMIAKLDFKSRRRTFRIAYERSEPSLLAVVLRSALVLWWLLSLLKLLK